MKRPPVFPHLLRRSQRGQSILLLAFAFIALIAFVGLVTDIALLFVRYAALRRAVDAAAIAAASQVREGSDFATISVIAEQYIELHNIDPRSVLVESCETDIHKWRLGLGPWEGEPHPEAAYSPVSRYMPETELCDWNDPRKLIRVSAQIESPTTFLALLGIDSITLEATSVGETAVLDVALVIDTSESMSQETNSTHYTAVGLSYGGGGSRTIRPECYTTAADLAAGIRPYARERWAGCCNDPGTGSVSDGTVRRSTGGYLPNGTIWHDANFNNMWDPGEDGLASSTAQSSSLTDPLGYNFTTLICQPFKQVKDAARMFIKRLDFVRGDRVVLVTFDRVGVAYDPDGAGTNFRPLLRSEQAAIDTLNQKVGVWVNPNRDHLHNICQEYVDAQLAWNQWIADGADPDEEPERRPFAYESIAPCGNTNIGGGILAASNALTDPVDVRRDAVWVMVVLSDGAANVTNRIPEASSIRDYGFYGFCPWWTFCNLNPDRGYVWPECTENNPAQAERALPYCNDNDPQSRHFCMDWETNKPEIGNPECGTAGHYDADDYARDMADFAGLIEIQPNIPGNFIAMFSIGFGQEVIDEPTAAPLLRYIADAGDNGFIDNNLQTDLREDRNPIPTYPIGGPYPDYYGDPDVCENTPTRVLHPTQQCGQYYFAAGLAELNDVFEEIASRMFTRLSR
jgi:hypothetical protein